MDIRKVFTGLRWWEVVSGLALLVLIPWRVIQPVEAAGMRGYGAYYNASRLLVNPPEGELRLYDNEWYADQIAEAGFTGVRDVFWVNPPGMTLVFVWLLPFDPLVGRWVLVAAGLAALAGGLGLLAQLFGWRGRAVIWLLPLGLLASPVKHNFEQQQVYLLLFLGLCLVWYGAARGRPWLSGISLGLMGGIKAAGLLLWLFLLVKRRWQILLIAAGVAGAVSLGVTLRFGWAAWGDFVRILMSLANEPKRTVTAYQTVSSLFGHLFSYHPEWNPAPLADLPWLSQALTLLVTAGSLGLTAYLCWRGGGQTESGREAQVLWLAAGSALLVANAPLAEEYHYCLALPSLLAAVWLAGREQAGWKTWAWLGLAAGLICVPLPYEAAGLSAGWLALLAYPRVYGVYMVWGWVARRMGRRS